MVSQTKLMLQERRNEHMNTMKIYGLIRNWTRDPCNLSQELYHWATLFDIHCPYSPNYCHENIFFYHKLQTWYSCMQFSMHIGSCLMITLYMYLCRWHSGTWIPTLSTQSWQNSLWIITLCLPFPLRLAGLSLAWRCCRWTGTCPRIIEF